MKILLVLLLLPVSAQAVNCGKDAYEYRGECVADIKPITAEPVKPSDEKPPEDKMPSYQREGIQIINAPNMAEEDAKADAEKRSADEQGKQSAGIKPR